MAWLPALLERKNATERALAGSIGDRGGFQVTRGVRRYVGGWDTERAVRDGLNRVIWVFKAVDTIAAHEARLPIVLHDAPVDGRVVPSRDPLLRRLNRRANPYEYAIYFRYRLTAQLLLSKKGVFVEVVRDNVGRVRELHLLPPDRTEPIPDPLRFVSHFEVHHLDGRIQELEPERVLWIRKPHPTDPYLSLTPLEAAGLAADVDFYARLYNRSFLANDGRPGGLVAVKGQMNQDDAAELKRRFSGGPTVAGRTTVIEADDVNWVDTAISPRDAQHVQTLVGSKADLLGAFGVPESMTGNASGRTFDNAAAEEQVFWRTTMRGYTDLIDVAFDDLLDGGVEDEVYLRHDFSDIAVLQRDKRERHAKALQEFQAGGLTLNEYLTQTGRDELDVPGARVHWLPMGKLPVGAPEDEAAALQLASGQPAAGPGLPTTASPDEFDADTPAATPELDSVRGGFAPDAFQAELETLLRGGGTERWRGAGRGAADRAEGKSLLELAAAFEADVDVDLD